MSRGLLGLWLARICERITSRMLLSLHWLLLSCLHKGKCIELLTLTLLRAAALEHLIDLLLLLLRSHGLTEGRWRERSGLLC